MTLEIRDRRLLDIVEEEAVMERVANGFGFTEGPIWHPREHFLIFSDIKGSRQYRWREGDGVQPFRLPSNQANGNAFDRQGRVVTCEHASSQLVRHEHDGKLVRVLAATFEGRELNSPNDVVVDRAGRIYFTDPVFGRLRPDLGIIRDPELDFSGVFRLDPDGSLHALVRDFDQPNGLCFDLDERKLFVNDTPRGHIRVFDVDEDGSLARGRVFAEVTGDGKGVADGMKIDASANLFCNGPGGVHVFDDEGTCLGVIHVPEHSTNFTFGDPDLGMLYVTASTSLYRIRTRTRGLPAF